MNLNKLLHVIKKLIGVEPQLKIAFLSQMRGGKDTAATYLINKYGGKNKKFTEPLYKIQKAVYKIIGRKEPVRDRALLQKVGTDWARDTISKTIWIDILIKSVNSYWQNYYLTDLRFINEADALRKEGFIIVKLVRDDQCRLDAGASHTNHASEMEVNDIKYDYLIENNKDLKHLHTQLDFIINDIFKWENL